MTSSLPVLSVITGCTNAALLAQVARLWIGPDDLVVDVTYGRGRWWTDYLPRRLVAHDIRLDGVDFRNLPEGNGAFDVVAFDPPYVVPGGRRTSTIGEMADRYGMHTTPRTPDNNALVIHDGVLEAARVLRPGGRLIAKSSDYVSGGRLFQGHRRLLDSADVAGFRQVDEYVHVTGTGPQPTVNLDGSPRRQVTSRRAHSFPCVFVDPKSSRGRPQRPPRSRQDVGHHVFES